MGTSKGRLAASAVLAWAIAGALFSASALGAAIVQELQGDVRAGATPADSQPVAANQRVLSGAVVTTGPGARVVLRFDDGQVAALHENAQLRIVDFRFQPQEPKADRAIFVLLQGALRMVTGALGQRNPEAFSLQAPQAFIGVRGTDFMVAAAAPGTYLSVLKGTVTATNAAGTAAFAGGTFASIAAPNTPAVSIPAGDLPAAVSSAFGNLGILPITAAAGEKSGGRDTAERARELKGDLGREFGGEVSDTARERARDRIPNIPSKSGRP